MLPDRVSNPGPLTYESGALPIALRGPALSVELTGTGPVSFWFFFIPFQSGSALKGKKFAVSYMLLYQYRYSTDAIYGRGQI